MSPELSKSAEALNAVGILKAVITIQEERGRLYGDGKTRERNMGYIVDAFKAITGKEISEKDGYLFMVALKLCGAATVANLMISRTSPRIQVWQEKRVRWNQRTIDEGVTR